MSEAVVDPVGDRTIVVQAGEHVLDPVQHGIDAGDVQEGFLLAGEAGIGQVFSGRRGAHRHRHRVTPMVATQAGIGIADIGFERRRQWGVGDPGANLSAGGDQGRDIIDIEAGQSIEDAASEILVLDELTVGIGGGREATGDRYTQIGQVADHFTQRGILAADLGEIGQAQAVQPKDIGVQWESPGEGGIYGGLRRPASMMRARSMADKIDRTMVLVLCSRMACRRSAAGRGGRR